MIGRRRPFRAGRRRAGVYLVVVAMLAVVALLAVTLSYVARSELVSARNAADAVQARVAALTGLPPLTVAAGSPAGAVSEALPVRFDPSTGRWSASEARAPLRLALAPSPIGESEGRVSGGRLRRTATGGDRRSSAGEGDRTAPFLAESSLARSLVEDESAKLNLNALLPARPASVVPARGTARGADPQAFDFDDEEPARAPREEHLAGLIERVVSARGLSLRRSAGDIAQAVSRRRFGADGRPGVAGRDDNANDAGAQPASDGLDNDADRIIDNPEEAGLAWGADGRDNNRDGRIDESGESAGTDGRDNNQDGGVDEPGEAIDEFEEFIADLRLPPRGDDRPFTRLEELLDINGVTPELLEALRPYLTVFSASAAAFEDPMRPGWGLPQADLNTAPPIELYETLRRRFPSVSADLIGQFVVNLVDRRDPDHVPTEFTAPSSGKKFWGAEITPLINEVCADSMSLDEDGDDGQFVEIINPWSRTLDLTGWRLETGRSWVTLEGVLPPGGILVVTDDYDNSRDPEPEPRGTGSFYDLYGVVPDGVRRRLIEDADFDLPNLGGEVRLYDPKGLLIDAFEYGLGSLAGPGFSFQRLDPRLRYARQTLPTPLEPNEGSATWEVRNNATLRFVESLHDQPFKSPLEAMLVSTAFAPEDPSSRTPPAHMGWRLPVLEGAGPDNFDIALVDGFAIDPPPSSAPAPAAPALSLESLSPEGRRDAARAAAPEAAGCSPAIFGRINLNTAAPVVLAALPGLDEELVYRIDQARRGHGALADDRGERGEPPHVDPALVQAYARSPDWFWPRSPLVGARWGSLSAFVKDGGLWGEAPLAERVRRVYPFSRIVTFDSLSFKATTRNLVASASEDPLRRPSRRRAERIIAGDRGSLETVTFRSLDETRASGSAPDLAFALPADPAGDRALRLLREVNPAWPKLRMAARPPAVDLPGDELPTGALGASRAMMPAAGEGGAVTAPRRAPLRAR